MESALRSRYLTLFIIAGLIALLITGEYFQPSYEEFLFQGTWRTVTNAGSQFAFAISLLIIWFGLGRQIIARFNETATISPLAEILVGSAAASIAFFTLAAFGLISEPIALAIIAAGLLYYRSDGRELFFHIANFLRQQHGASIVGISIIFLALRASAGDLTDTDVVHFYWRWMNDVSANGSIWITQKDPIILDFFAGRGAGNYLFSAPFGLGLATHMVSGLYCILIAFSIRQFVLQEMGQNLARQAWLANMFCAVIIFYLPTGISLGKYHLQLVSWSLSVILLLNSSGPMRARLAMTSIILGASAIALPQILALQIPTALFLQFLNRKSVSLRAGAVSLILIPAICAAASLLLNAFYIGIPDVNPFQVFRYFEWPQRFNLWTSNLAQEFLNELAGGAIKLKLFDRQQWADVAAAIKIAPAQNGLLLAVPTLVMVGFIVLPVPALISSIAGFIALLAYLQFRGTVLPFAFLLGGLSPFWFVTVIVLSFTLLFRLRSKNSLSKGELSLLFYSGLVLLFMLAVSSGSMARLLAHVPIVIFALAFIFSEKMALTAKNSERSLVMTGLVLGLSFIAAFAPFNKIDQWQRPLAAGLGMSGHITGLPGPENMARSCLELRATVPAGSKILFLNAYTPMAYCDNATLLPREMLVSPHGSIFSRDIAKSSFSEAANVEATLRALDINFFAVLKRNTEFWYSGFAAVFSPGELEKRIGLYAETESYYILTWQNNGRLPTNDSFTAITEWRRIGIQQHGFMLNDQFLGQWRAMVNLGATRPVYVLGELIDFTSAGWSALYADRGWYAAEPDGTWTIGPRAILTLPLAAPIKDGLIDIELKPLLLQQIPQRPLAISVNGVQVFSRALTDQDTSLRIEIPADALATTAVVSITFDVGYAISPLRFGHSEDHRRMGVKVKSLRLTQRSY